MEDTSGYEKSVVQHARLGWKDIVLVKLHVVSRLIPAVLGMVK